jgi:hypothetical protein
MYEIRHETLVFAQKLQKRGLYVVNENIIGGNGNRVAP